jgi:acetyltransferase-like isoleucine patch superfamily enzyme
MLQEFIQKIRRKETPGYQKLYSLADSLLRFNMPGFLSPFYRCLFAERQARIHFFRQIATVLYYEPMFRAKCKSVGTGFKYVKLHQNFPYFGGNLSIILGDRVTVHSRSSFVGGKIYPLPKLEIGNRTYLGPGFSVGISKRVTIGSDCLIGEATIMDNDGHPLDSEKRIKNYPVEKKDIKPIDIRDKVWVGNRVTILKGVTIGEGAVIAPGTIVASNVPAHALAAGNPARVIPLILKD